MKLCMATFLSALVLASCSNDKAPPGPLAGQTDQGELKYEVIKNAPASGDFWLDLPTERSVETLLSKMSDDEIVSQVFMVSWPGLDLDADLASWIKSKGIGGIKIFGWNAGEPEKLAQTIGQFQKAALGQKHSIPLLVATDQEGGWVRHIKKGTSQSAGNMGLGADGLPRDSYFTGLYIGRELRAMGVNMNFAPTVDLLTNLEAHVIGPRAFSDDPKLTSLLSAAFFQGQDETMVISTAKHFPGHGNALGDSHGVLPVIEDDEATLNGREFEPYKMLIEQGLPAILSGHLNFPKISGDDRPASISKKILTDILRVKLGFKGLVMTDDLYMGGALDYGVKKGWLVGQIITESIEAGNDMVMLSRTPHLNDAIYDYVLRKYQTDQAFNKTVKASVARVLKIKLDYLKPSERVPLDPDTGALNAVLNDQKAREFFKDQSIRSVTQLSKELEVIPRSARVLLVSQSNDFIRSSQNYFANAQVINFPYDPFYGVDTLVGPDVIARSKSFDYVILCIANPYGASVLDQLSGIAKKLYVVSSLSPAYLAKTPWVRNALAVYGYNRDSMDAGFEVIVGNRKPFAQIPLSSLR